MTIRTAMQELSDLATEVELPIQRVRDSIYQSKEEAKYYFRKAEESLKHWKDKFDSIECHPKTIKRSFQRIRNIQGLTKISIGDDDLCLETAPIVITTPAAYYIVGKIEIKIMHNALDSAGITFRNLDGHRPPHPHARNYDGSEWYRACFGEATNVINEMLQKAMFADLIVLLLQWLRSVNTEDSWGEQIVVDKFRIVPRRVTELPYSIGSKVQMNTTNPYFGDLPRSHKTGIVKAFAQCRFSGKEWYAFVDFEGSVIKVLISELEVVDE